jgi:ABC-type Fe3+/spermidine/putrescine transport system ATPase subunit
MNALGNTNMTATKPAAVEVRGLAKHYGSVVALQDVNIKIEAGEYFVLLGPSGGGKTTLLRTIGGFHKPTKGAVLLHGQDVSHLPPDKRPTSMVFQSYALFPHMNVLQNVGYGLKVAGLSKRDNLEKSAAALELVGLTGFESRKPHELSGGQQQRVQLARAMVLERDILLLDEPLAALDAQLRKDMCLELKHLQEKVGITFIHVTHNQEEAMTVADRIALIASGELVEHGNARDIYRAPDRTFTASFVGENNMMSGAVTEVSGDKVTVQINGTDVQVNRRGKTVSTGDKVSLSIRSELTRMTLDPSDAQAQPGHAVTGSYREGVYLGLTTSHLVDVGTGHDLVCRVVDDLDVLPQKDQPVTLYWRAGDLRLHTQ